VRLQVGDLDRSIDWYGRVLALHAEEPGVAGANSVDLTGTDGTPLVRLVERPGAHPHPPRGRLGLFHYAVLLPDRASLGAFLAHVRSLGIPLGASDHLVSEALYLTDPDGLGIEVYADRPREAWPRTGGSLRMDTLPLDVPSLLDAAAAAGWAGPPPRAAIGHVHLHVGDLATAEAFYGDALGLVPTARGYPGALFLAADGYHHHLGLNTWAGPGATPPGEGEASLLEWEIVLPDGAALEAASGRMREAGYEPIAVVGATDAGVRTGPAKDERTAGGPGTVFADPWGTRVRLRA
jgi:catechol 2,3-dioxygenase